METILEDYEFLDLSDASDFERSRIKRILVRPVADNGQTQRHFHTPWNPPPPSSSPPPHQQLPHPQAPAVQSAYHGVQLNGGGSRPADMYQAAQPPPPQPAMMQPPPPAPRPVVQLNPQAGVFVNTQPFPGYSAYPPQTPPEVVVGRQGPRPGGGGKKRDVTPTGIVPVMWNQPPPPPHYYAGAAPVIVSQFSPVPAPAYVSPPAPHIDEQELKEQVPYSPYNPPHHPTHHQHHHHHHPHHQPHYPQEQHHHHQRPMQHIQMAPAPVTITAPVAAPVAITAPVAAPVTITAPPVTPVLPPPSAVQIVPLKFSNNDRGGGNQLINGPKPVLMPGTRQPLVKPVTAHAPPATAVETKARVKSVAVPVKEDKPQPVNSIPAAAVVKVEKEEKIATKPAVMTSSNDVNKQEAKPTTQPAAKPNDVTNQPPATVKPAEVQPPPKPVVSAAPPQVTAPPAAAATVPPPTVTAPVPAAPSYASLFSNSSSSPSAASRAPPSSRRYSGGVAAPPTPQTPSTVNHHAASEQDRAATRTSGGVGEYSSASKAAVASLQQKSVNSVPQPSHSVTSSSNSATSSANNVSPLAGDPGLQRLAEYLSTYKLDHRAALLKPRGLTNRSNYCYINATLQALLACPPLYNLLKKLPLPPRKSHAASKSKTPIIDSMVQFVNEFEEMVSAPSLLKSRREKQQAARDDKQQTETVAAGAAFEPTYVYRMINAVIRNESAFPVEGRQEDAEEFLSCLLNGLNDEMVELLRLTDDNMSNGEVIATNGDNYLDQDSDNEWKEISKKKPTITRRTKLVSTPLSQIFQGQWRSRVVRQGASETDNIQPFFTFPLDIEKAHSVKDALENITTKNMLEGFTCPKTNRTIEAYQQLYLEELPLVLLLHLKCFDYRLQTCSKIIKNVEFSIELKIEPKLMATTGKKNNNNNNTNNNRSPGSSMKEREYKLFAVVYHDGKEATKGHYVTDVYHVGYGTWLRYDDANVRAVSQNAVLTPRAPRVPYLLYYRRKDTIAPPPTNAKNQKTAANES